MEFEIQNVENRTNAFLYFQKSKRPSISFIIIALSIQIFKIFNTLKLQPQLMTSFFINFDILPHSSFFEKKRQINTQKKDQKKDTKNLKKTIKGNPEIKTMTTKSIENARHEGLYFFLFIVNFHSRMKKTIK